MNWRPKPIATGVTALVCALYFNVIFCDEMDRGRRKHHQALQVVDMTLTFSSPLPSANTEKNQQNTPPETTSSPPEPEVPKPMTKPAVKPNKPVKRLAVVPVKKPEVKPIVKKKPIAKTKVDIARAKHNDDNKPHEKDVAKNNKPTSFENNSQPSPTSAIVQNTSSAASSQRTGVESVMHDYMGQVRDYIAKQKRYPIEAKIRRHQGNVTISFIIDADGRVSESKIIQACKSRYINKSVKTLLSKLRFNAAPQEIRDQFPKIVVLDVNYQFG
ncbi:energy transducer TonB [Colwellia sp. Arc7-635]|uniref:energy transducer TonB n=1 Tax=Colwellia sp. Arc7-635 TaxID=2497879 RepID=UPI000F85282F|nr:energy transducer TonB [Colwellia sp. Arc7-635]AZQ84285.1 energy transducer TonB [Colwellia sp. Arc7-635]